jgi:membrane associated rhomboid family serine protease
MIPLKDTAPVRRFPIVNTMLISLNVLVFLIEFAMGDGLYRFIFYYGLVPAQFWQLGWLRWWTPFTSMFIHAGWIHLFSNMLSLYIFGDNVEDQLGHLRYFFFYIGSGLAASAAHLVAHAGSPNPTVGASGAIAGILGAYLVLFPSARIITLIPVFYFAPLVRIRAVIYLVLWFISQLFNGFFVLTDASTSFQGSGVAWMAHIGGFVFGFVIVSIVRIIIKIRTPPPPPPTPPYYYTDSRWE